MHSIEGSFCEFFFYVRDTYRYSNEIAYYLSALCCLDEKLTQGASTSPYLSNILLRSFDRRLYRLSEKYDFSYTRYADDLTFSGAYIPHDFVQIVGTIVSEYGLKVNESKTRLHTTSGQRIVTGLSVNGVELKLPRNTKRELRQELYYIKKFGFIFSKKSLIITIKI